MLKRQRDCERKSRKEIKCKYSLIQVQNIIDNKNKIKNSKTIHDYRQNSMNTRMNRKNLEKKILVKKNTAKNKMKAHKDSEESESH